MNRRPLYQWAKEYVGDPASHETRGDLILQLLTENGLRQQSHVLDIGCGSLSQGVPLINYLNTGCYAGIEPNGWLIEAALNIFPSLESKQPEFLYRSDFDASELDLQFDYVVAHSVLSHAAHWQLNQMLVNVRKSVPEGAIWLCSFIGDQYNSHDSQWVYPGVSRFRLQSVMAAGFHAGWRVELMPDYQRRMIEVCPNDTHNWLRLTATPSAEEMNDLRLKEETLQAEEIQELVEIETERQFQAREEDNEKIVSAGLVP